MNNPFVTNGYAGERYFCDRVEETQSLIELLTNGNNVALISPRRLGKTDLIRHCFAQPVVKDNYYTFLIDIYATSCRILSMHWDVVSSTRSSLLAKK